MANWRASSKGSLNVVFSVAARPIRSVTAASAASTVSESGRPTTSRSKIRPRCSRRRRPSARKKKSNLPRSAVWARCTNEAKSVWLPDVGIAPDRRVVDAREVGGEVDLLAAGHGGDLGGGVAVGAGGRDRSGRAACPSCGRTRPRSASRGTTSSTSQSSVVGQDVGPEQEPVDGALRDHDVERGGDAGGVVDDVEPPTGGAARRAGRARRRSPGSPTRATASTVDVVGVPAGRGRRGRGCRRGGGGPCRRRRRRRARCRRAGRRPAAAWSSAGVTTTSGWPWGERGRDRRAADAEERGPRSRCSAACRGRRSGRWPGRG